MSTEVKGQNMSSPYLMVQVGDTGVHPLNRHHFDLKN